MEPHLAVAEGADGRAVHLDVGDEHHARIGLQHAFRARAQLLARLRHLALAQFAEARGKAQLLLLRDVLAAEDEDEMLRPGVLDECDRRFRQILGEIDALDHGAAGRRERRDLGGKRGFHWRARLVAAG